jgi:hypothetical protein
VFFRDDEGEWGHEFLEADGVLRMPEIGVEAPIGEFYEGVETS